MKKTNRVRQLLLLIFAIIILLSIFLFINFIGYQKKTVPKIGLIITGSCEEKGWNGAHYQGVKYACEQLNAELIVKENILEGTGDCEEAVREVISEGAGMIILSSYAYPEELRDVVTEYPDIAFYGISAEHYAENMTSFFGRMYQARYLAGIVAGMKTESNQIGYVAAMENNEVNRGISAFTLGVRSVNPEAVVNVIFTGTWDDEAKEKAAAKKDEKVAEKEGKAADKETKAADKETKGEAKDGKSASKDGKAEKADGKGESGERSGKFHQRIVEAEDDRSHVVEPLVVQHSDEFGLVTVLVLRDHRQLRIGSDYFPVRLAGGAFAAFHQLQREGESEDAGAEDHPGDLEGRGSGAVAENVLDDPGVVRLVGADAFEKLSVRRVFLKLPETGVYGRFGQFVAQLREQGGGMSCCFSHWDG